MTPTLIVVDDDPVISTIVAGSARPLGIDVEAVSTVRECLEKLDGRGAANPLALLVDICMRDEDAFDLISALSARECRVPIIFMTGLEPEQLPLAREIARIHGLEVVDAMLKPIDHTRLRGNLERLQDEIASALLGRWRVLVVDDDPLVRSLTAETLRTADFQVKEAEDGFDALEQLCAGEQIDLLVTDLEMPRMNGIEVALKVNRLYPHVKILIISGEQVAAPLVAAAFLQKPFRLEVLIRSARSVLGRPAPT